MAWTVLPEAKVQAQIIRLDIPYRIKTWAGHPGLPSCFGIASSRQSHYHESRFSAVSAIRPISRCTASLGMSPLFRINSYDGLFVFKRRFHTQSHFNSARPGHRAQKPGASRAVRPMCARISPRADAVTLARFGAASLASGQPDRRFRRRGLRAAGGRLGGGATECPKSVPKCPTRKNFCCHAHAPARSGRLCLS
jgi:hypothetical protein